MIFVTQYFQIQYKFDIRVEVNLLQLLYTYYIPTVNDKGRYKL